MTEIPVDTKVDEKEEVEEGGEESVEQEGDEEEMLVGFEACYGSFTTTRCPKEEVTYSIKWTLNNPLPEGVLEPKTLLEVKKEYNPSTDVNRSMEGGKFTIVFQLNNDHRALIIGDYSVEVYISGELQKKKDFRVVGRKGLYLGLKYDTFGIPHPMTTFDGHVHTIWGMYHFEGPQKLHEEIKSGQIVWKRIKEEEEGNEEEEETIFSYNIDLKGNTKFNVFRFRLPKQKPGVFPPSRYVCIVLINEKEAERKEFVIEKAMPKLFLGTRIEPKTYDMLDDRVVFEGNTRLIFGLYKFCRKVPKEKIGRVRWFIEQPRGMVKYPRPKALAEHKINCSNDYDIMIFKLDLVRLMALPGIYMVELFLDDDLLVQRRFKILPRYDIIFGKIENDKIPKAQHHYVHGIKEITGLFKSNIVFPAQTEMVIQWISSKVEGIKLNSILTTSVQVLPIDFSTTKFSCALKEPFPIGEYEARCFMNKKYVGKSKFKIFSEQEFNEFQEKKRKLTERYLQQMQQMRAAQQARIQQQQQQQQQQGGGGGQTGKKKLID